MIGGLGQDNPLSREGDVISRVYARLRKAAEDGLVRGIILKLDTPGGDVTSSDILYRENPQVQETTGPAVVGLMMGVRASEDITFPPLAILLWPTPRPSREHRRHLRLPSVAGLISKVGVDVRVIKSGRSRTREPFRGMSPEEQKVFEGMITEMYEDFLRSSTTGAKTTSSMDELRRLADGRVYTGLRRSG